MREGRLITGITVSRQMSVAMDILRNQVIPREKKYRAMKKNVKRSLVSKSALKTDA